MIKGNVFTSQTFVYGNFQHNVKATKLLYNNISKIEAICKNAFYI